MSSDVGAECSNIHIVVLEQPAEVHRYGFECEMMRRNWIVGERSNATEKTFPEVELRNFNGKGVIRCSLFQKSMSKPLPHPHKLVAWKDAVQHYDPLDVYVSREMGYKARFERMRIIQTLRKNIVNVLFAKKVQRLKFESRREVLSEVEENQLKDEAENEKPTIDLREARLYFEAFEIGEDNVWKRIAQPVFSNIIYNHNLHPLKISHLCTTSAGAAGGDEVTILIEKLSTENVKVRFFELDGDQEVWEAFAEYSNHHGYALIVRTPPYKHQDIRTNVNVFIELVRSNEGSIKRSLPVSFKYKPQDMYLTSQGNQ